MVLDELIEYVDDQLGNVADGDREQGGNKASNDAEGHHARSGLPDDLQDRRNVAQGDEALLPAAPKTALLLHCR